LPIQQYKKEIIETIKNNRVTIICGETGSGKTTQIPQFISELFNKILITQPRRISAITLA
jgi:HrpA-like RNA helicase